MRKTRISFSINKKSAKAESSEAPQAVSSEPASSSMPVFKASSYYACRFCCKRLKSKEQFETHKKTKSHMKAVKIGTTNEQKKSRSCAGCKQSFDTRLQLTEHCKRFSHMPLVQKTALKNPEYGKAYSESEQEDPFVSIKYYSPYYCEVCDLDCVCDVHYQDHVKGSRHEKAIQKRAEQGGVVLVDLDNQEVDNTDNCLVIMNKIEPVTETVSAYYCGICDTDCRSELAYTEHVTSKDHQVRMHGHGQIKISCDLCCMNFNSENNYKMHLKSKKHAHNEAARQRLLPLGVQEEVKADSVHDLRDKIKRTISPTLESFDKIKVNVPVVPSQGSSARSVMITDEETEAEEATLMEMGRPNVGKKSDLDAKAKQDELERGKWAKKKEDDYARRKAEAEKLLGSKKDAAPDNGRGRGGPTSRGGGRGRGRGRGGRRDDKFTWVNPNFDDNGRAKDRKRDDSRERRDRKPERRDERRDTKREDKRDEKRDVKREVKREEKKDDRREEKKDDRREENKRDSKSDRRDKKSERDSKIRDSDSEDEYEERVIIKKGERQRERSASNDDDDDLRNVINKQRKEKVTTEKAEGYSDEEYVVRPVAVPEEYNRQVFDYGHKPMEKMDEDIEARDSYYGGGGTSSGRYYDDRERSVGVPQGYYDEPRVVKEPSHPPDIFGGEGPQKSLTENSLLLELLKRQFPDIRYLTEQQGGLELLQKIFGELRGKGGVGDLGEYGGALDRMYGRDDGVHSEGRGGSIDGGSYRGGGGGSNDGAGSVRDTSVDRGTYGPTEPKRMDSGLFGPVAPKDLSGDQKDFSVAEPGIIVIEAGAQRRVVVDSGGKRKGDDEQEWREVKAPTGTKHAEEKTAKEKEGESNRQKSSSEDKPRGEKKEPAKGDTKVRDYQKERKRSRSRSHSRERRRRSRSSSRDRARYRGKDSSRKRSRSSSRDRSYSKRSKRTPSPARSSRKDDGKRKISLSPKRGDKASDKRSPGDENTEKKDKKSEKGVVSDAIAKNKDAKEKMIAKWTVSNWSGNDNDKRDKEEQKIREKDKSATKDTPKASKQYEGKEKGYTNGDKERNTPDRSERSAEGESKSRKIFEDSSDYEDVLLDEEKDLKRQFEADYDDRTEPRDDLREVDVLRDERRDYRRDDRRDSRRSERRGERREERYDERFDDLRDNLNELRFGKRRASDASDNPLETALAETLARLQRRLPTMDDIRGSSIPKTTGATAVKDENYDPYSYEERAFQAQGNPYNTPPINMDALAALALNYEMLGRDPLYPLASDYLPRAVPNIPPPILPPVNDPRFGGLPPPGTRIQVSPVLLQPGLGLAGNPSFGRGGSALRELAPVKDETRPGTRNPALMYIQPTEEPPAQRRAVTSNQDTRPGTSQASRTTNDRNLPISSRASPTLRTTPPAPISPIPRTPPGAKLEPLRSSRYEQQLLQRAHSSAEDEDDVTGLDDSDQYNSESASKPLKSILKKQSKFPAVSQAPVPSSSANQTPATSSNLPKNPVGAEYVVQSSGEQGKFICQICDVQFTTLSAKNLHLRGPKHLAMFMKQKSPLIDQMIEQAMGSIGGKPGNQDDKVDNKTQEKIEIENRAEGKHRDRHDPVREESLKTRDQVLEAAPRGYDTDALYGRRSSNEPRLFVDEKTGRVVQSENYYSDEGNTTLYGERYGDAVASRRKDDRGLDDRGLDERGINRALDERGSDRARDDPVLDRFRDDRARDLPRALDDRDEQDYRSIRDDRYGQLPPREQEYYRDEYDRMALQRDLPPRDLPPRDLPPRDLPPRDLSPRDLPPRDDYERQLRRESRVPRSEYDRLPPHDYGRLPREEYDYPRNRADLPSDDEYRRLPARERSPLPSRADSRGPPVDPRDRPLSPSYRDDWRSDRVAREGRGQQSGDWDYGDSRGAPRGPVPPQETREATAPYGKEKADVSKDERGTKEPPKEPTPSEGGEPWKTKRPDELRAGQTVEAKEPRDQPPTSGQTREYEGVSQSTRGPEGGGKDWQAPGNGRPPRSSDGYGHQQPQPPYRDQYDRGYGGTGEKYGGNTDSRPSQPRNDRREQSGGYGHDAPRRGNRGSRGRGGPRGGSRGFNRGPGYRRGWNSGQSRY